MNMLNEVLSASEAAEMLGVTKRAVVQLCTDNKLTARKALGSGWMILKTSVDERLERVGKRP